MPASWPGWAQKCTHIRPSIALYLLESILYHALEKRRSREEGRRHSKAIEWELTNHVIPENHIINTDHCLMPLGHPPLVTLLATPLYAAHGNCQWISSD